MNNIIKFEDEGDKIKSYIDCEPAFAFQCLEHLMSEFLMNTMDYEFVENRILELLEKYKYPTKRKLD